MNAEPEAGAADPAVDFFSSSFDPEQALSRPGLQPPDPSAPPLDNVAKCRSILPAEHPDALCNVVKKQASEASKLKASQFKERAAKLTERIQDSCHLSLDNVHGFVKPGPVQSLGQWLKEGRRIRVVTRHARGVRGVATGQLMAYDRFMNIVLKDVEEEYTVRLRVQKVKQPDGTWAAAGSGSSGAAAGGTEAGRTQPAAAQAGPPAGAPGELRAPAAELLSAGAHVAGGRAGAGVGVRFTANLTSADVDPVEPGELGEVAVPVLKEKFVYRQDHRRRQLAQIFIKGDNVVLVSREQQPNQPPTQAQPS